MISLLGRISVTVALIATVSSCLSNSKSTKLSTEEQWPTEVTDDWDLMSVIAALNLRPLKQASPKAIRFIDASSWGSNVLFFNINAKPTAGKSAGTITLTSLETSGRKQMRKATMTNEEAAAAWSSAAKVRETRRRLFAEDTDPETKTIDAGSVLLELVDATGYSYHVIPGVLERNRPPIVESCLTVLYDIARKKKLVK